MAEFQTFKSSLFLCYEDILGSSVPVGVLSITLLEYDIIFPTIEKTGRKPCCVREQIIGIVMASERDFDNVTCVWSCNLYAL